MGAVKQILDESRGAAGVAREVLRHQVADRLQVLVEIQDDGPMVVLCFERHTRMSPSAPWSTERTVRYEISAAQARHLGQLLEHAAARTETAEADHG